MTIPRRIKLNYFRFDVTDGPRYGRLERLRGNGRWVSTKRFYSRQLDKEKVRYVQLTSTDDAEGENVADKDAFYFRDGIHQI
jgi:hypothetical protein